MVIKLNPIPVISLSDGDIIGNFKGVLIDKNSVSHFYIELLINESMPNVYKNMKKETIKIDISDIISINDAIIIKDKSVYKYSQMDKLLSCETNIYAVNGKYYGNLSQIEADDEYNIEYFVCNSAKIPYNSIVNIGNVILINENKFDNDLNIENEIEGIEPEAIEPIELENNYEELETIQDMDINQEKDTELEEIEALDFEDKDSISIDEDEEMISFDEESINLGEDDEAISFGDEESISFGDDSEELDFEEIQEDLTFEQAEEEIAFEESVEDMEFGDGSEEIGFEEPVEDMEFGDGSEEIGFEEPVEDMEFGDSSEEPVEDMEFGDGSEEIGFEEPVEDMEFEDGSEEIALKEPAEEIAFEEHIEDMELEENEVIDSEETIEEPIETQVEIPQESIKIGEDLEESIAFDDTQESVNFEEDLEDIIEMEESKENINIEDKEESISFGDIENKVEDEDFKFDSELIKIEDETYDIDKEVSGNIESNSLDFDEEEEKEEEGTYYALKGKKILDNIKIGDIEYKKGTVVNKQIINDAIENNGIITLIMSVEDE